MADTSADTWMLGTMLDTSVKCWPARPTDVLSISFVCDCYWLGSGMVFRSRSDKVTQWSPASMRWKMYGSRCPLPECLVLWGCIVVLILHAQMIHFVFIWLYWCNYFYMDPPVFLMLPPYHIQKSWAFKGQMSEHRHAYFCLDQILYSFQRNRRQNADIPNFVD